MFRKPEWMDDREWKRERIQLWLRVATTVIASLALILSVVKLLLK